MSKKSKRKVDVKSSILILLLIAILLMASTYAWFTANTTVTVSQLNVQVEAQNGLQISADASNWKSVLSNADIDPTGTLSTTYATNTNQIPILIDGSADKPQMEPVSTTGTVTSGKLDMFYGTVTANQTTGGYDLTAVKQTDIQGKTGKYIAFDIFLKVDKVTQIALTPQSQVVFKDATSKGLENATRVAFLVEGNVAAGAGAAAAQALSSAESFGTGDTTHIWEPNYDTHTAAGIANASDTYGKTGLQPTGSAAQSYYGVKADIDSAHAVDIKKTEDSTNSAYFAAVSPDYKTINGFDANYNIFTLQAGITKIRTYMWIEGQDVDCENTASGANIGFNLQFTIVS